MGLTLGCKDEDFSSRAGLLAWAHEEPQLEVVDGEWRARHVTAWRSPSCVIIHKYLASGRRGGRPGEAEPCTRKCAHVRVSGVSNSDRSWDPRGGGCGPRFIGAPRPCGSQAAPASAPAFAHFLVWNCRRARMGGERGGEKRGDRLAPYGLPSPPRRPSRRYVTAKRQLRVMAPLIGRATDAC